MDLLELLGFAEKVSELKCIKRTGWVRRKVREPESVADHSFMVTVLACFYSKKFGMNSGKCIKMALLHDICEVYAGDIPYRIKSGTRERKLKMKKEREGLKRIISLLPRGKGKEILSLWNEWEKQKSKEARLVRDLDKLEMCMQALRYAEKYGKAKFAEFFEDGRKNIKTRDIKKIFLELYERFRELPK
jgi:putative hydrolase of HD superfamily